MLRIAALLGRRHEHRVLGLMLLLLHLAVWWDFGGALSRSLMIAHLGLFLMWQPLMSRERQLDWRAALVFVALTLAFVASLTWWLVTVWLLLLIGIVGGRPNVQGRDRYIHLVALVFVVTEVLIGCVPPTFSVRTISGEFNNLVRWGLLPVPVALLFVPSVSAPTASALRVEFLYGLTMSLLTIVLSLGSLLSMYVTGVDYPTALVQTVLAIALFLLAISWLWMPLAGFSGLGQLWQRYLQNIGTPFEDWLSGLAQLARGRQTPEQFLDAAMERLAVLPWVAGVVWQGEGFAGERGERTPHALTTRAGNTALTIHSRVPMGTALVLHCRLLLQLVGYFLVAKQHEQELARHAHVQAIYETGARITHDIKNLLQSLQTLTAAVEHSGDEDQAALQQLLRRQLPGLGARLELALDKLQAPDRDESRPSPLSSWWETVQERHAGRDITFESTLDADPDIPAECFDSVVDNLLENARIKRLTEPNVAVRVTLRATDGRVTLRVCDTGSPVDDSLAAHLFTAPVKSRTGLGVGLYQAARHARNHGATLSLAGTGSGPCFELSWVQRGP